MTEPLARKKAAWIGRRTALGVFFLFYFTCVLIWPSAGWLIPVCMGGGFGLALFSGRRLWCAKFCPRGNFLAAFLRFISLGETIPAQLAGPVPRWSLATGLMCFMLIKAFLLWPDKAAVAGFFVMVLSVTTAAAVVLGVFFQPRTWCRLCPLGTVADAAGR